MVDLHGLATKSLFSEPGSHLYTIANVVWMFNEQKDTRPEEICDSTREREA